MVEAIRLERSDVVKAVTKMILRFRFAPRRTGICASVVANSDQLRSFGWIPRYDVVIEQSYNTHRWELRLGSRDGFENASSPRHRLPIWIKTSRRKILDYDQLHSPQCQSRRGHWCRAGRGARGKPGSSSGGAPVQGTGLVDPQELEPAAARHRQGGSNAGRGQPALHRHLADGCRSRQSPAL